VKSQPAVVGVGTLRQIISADARASASGSLPTSLAEFHWGTSEHLDADSANGADDSVPGDGPVTGGRMFRHD
jgi:hypothetical protein